MFVGKPLTAFVRCLGALIAAVLITLAVTAGREAPGSGSIVNPEGRFSAPGCKLQTQDERISARQIASLMSKARRQGTINIIVKLCLEAVPEGELLTDQEVQKQRALIAQTQHNLLKELARYKVAAVKKYEFIPFIAMQVSAPALRFLNSSPLVAAIEEDKELPVAATGQQVMTNLEVVALVRGGMSDEKIIKRIQNSSTKFDTTAEGLKELRANNVSQAIINVMCGIGQQSSATVDVKSEQGTAKPKATSRGNNRTEELTPEQLEALDKATTRANPSVPLPSREVQKPIQTTTEPVVPVIGQPCPGTSSNQEKKRSQKDKHVQKQGSPP